LVHDHDVVLQGVKSVDVEAGSGRVAGPHPESAVAGLLGRSGQLVAQIGEQPPVIRRVHQPLTDQVMVGAASQCGDFHEDGGTVVVRRGATADKGNAPAVEVGRAREDVTSYRVGDAGCDRFIWCANDVAETQPVEQLGRGSVRQTQRLMSARGAVVGLQRVDGIQPQLGGSGSIAFDPVGACDQIPFRGVVGCEADRVSIGLSARDSETARDEEHGHGKLPPFELMDETKSAFAQCLWRE
jgi:hypothetical protein